MKTKMTSEQMFENGNRPMAAAESKPILSGEEAMKKNLEDIGINKRRINNFIDRRHRYLECLRESNKEIFGNKSDNK